MKKRTGLTVLSFILAVMSFTGCGAESSASNVESGETKTESTESVAEKKTEEVTESGSENSEDNSKPLSIVCTIFPEYDWVKEIMGDRAEGAEITYLLDNGSDLHSYQPTVDDIVKITECDLFVYVGGESDEWVEDVLDKATNPNMKVINLMDVMGDSAKAEELKEGMQESEHEHEHNTDFDDSEVKDRCLDEWNGSWQSTYPLLLDGSLDDVWEYKADNDDSMSAEDYKNKYTDAYKTDIVTININAPSVEYVTEDGSVSADYEYSGFYIRTKDDGSKQVRYKFEKKSGDDSAMQYIVFSDHNIEPSEPEHFHLYSGNDGFDSLVEEGTHFPTYYPSELSAEDIVDEMTGGHSHEEEEEYDEHVWLSLRNAEILCTEIEQNLAEIDPKNADIYKNNLNSYIEKLDNLDSDFSELADSAEVKTLVFGDRFPFRYFVDDYNLDYYAAFVGCSSETQASFETVTFLAEKVKELDCKTVFTLENSDKSIAEAVISTSGTDAKIAELNSVQSVSGSDIENGVTYLSLMQKNYDVLKENLK